ncbi:hypothetical protein CCUS01_17432 [Colletotrichum cuscutae]|uniref:Uncharacterized protein n=1 Tax=Colletotrichum cuscutae TaxID=1209917 RepID=A0AAI9V6K6_9PEZI|nr:hypothetical protein CCUS01_17432 [Colletotrichum cuscutae]
MWFLAKMGSQTAVPIPPTLHHSLPFNVNDTKTSFAFGFFPSLTLLSLHFFLPRNVRPFPQRPLLQTPGRGNALLSFRQIPLTFLFSFSDGIIRSILSFPMGPKVHVWFKSHSNSLLHGLTGSLAHNCFSLFPSPHPRLLSVLFCNNSPTHRSKVNGVLNVPSAPAARLDGNDESPPSGGLLGILIPMDGLTPRNSTTIPTGLALLFVAQLTDYCKSWFAAAITSRDLRCAHPTCCYRGRKKSESTPTRFDILAFSNVFASHPITPALPKNTRSYVFGPPAVVPAALPPKPPSNEEVVVDRSIHTDPFNGRPSSKCMWADSPIIIEGSGFKNPDSIPAPTQEHHKTISCESTCQLFSAKYHYCHFLQPPMYQHTSLGLHLATALFGGHLRASMPTSCAGLKHTKGPIQSLIENRYMPGIVPASASNFMETQSNGRKASLPAHSKTFSPSQSLFNNSTIWSRSKYGGTMENSDNILLTRMWQQRFRPAYRIKPIVSSIASGPKHENKQVFSNYFAYSMTTYHQRRVPCATGETCCFGSLSFDGLTVLNKDYNYSLMACRSKSRTRGSKSQVSPILKLNRIYERSLPQSPDHLHRKHQNLASRPDCRNRPQQPDQGNEAQFPTNKRMSHFPNPCALHTYFRYFGHLCHDQLLLLLEGQALVPATPGNHESPVSISSHSTEDGQLLMATSCINWPWLLRDGSRGWTAANSATNPSVGSVAPANLSPVITDKLPTSGAMIAHDGHYEMASLDNFGTIFLILRYDLSHDQRPNWEPRLLATSWGSTHSRLASSVLFGDSLSYAEPAAQNWVANRASFALTRPSFKQSRTLPLRAVSPAAVVTTGVITRRLNEGRLPGRRKMEWSLPVAVYDSPVNPELVTQSRESYRSTSTREFPWSASLLSSFPASYNQEAQKKNLVPTLMVMTVAERQYARKREREKKKKKKKYASIPKREEPIRCSYPLSVYTAEDILTSSRWSILEYDRSFMAGGGRELSGLGLAQRRVCRLE